MCSGAPHKLTTHAYMQRESQQWCVFCLSKCRLSYHDDGDEDGEDDDGGEDGAEDVEAAEGKAAAVSLLRLRRREGRRRLLLRPSSLLAPLQRPHHDCEVREVVALALRGRRVGERHTAAGVGPAPAN